MNSITFLGTGTSIGVPMIGCGCKVCTSNDPRDARLRCSVLLQLGDTRILIDSGPDFRMQALRHGITHLDALMITHNHYDHLYGLDDVRPLGDTPIYGEQIVLDTIRKIMPYCFGPNKYPGSPTIRLCEVKAGELLRVNDVEILPIRVMHGRLPIVGYRFGSLAYITDASMLPEETFEALKGVETLVINALRITPHPSHFSLEESIAAAQRIGAKRTYFTHFSHEIGLHAVTDATLPEGMQLAYDGLTVQNV